MIPKVIHYCWFGRNPLPESAQKCIASWKKFLPDYEIKEWNEENFDVNIIPYTKEAYEAKKYAFVSDYARFWILYHYGGMYFDTDVEIIKPMDDIIAHGPFMGIELIGVDGLPLVNPGLGLGTECNNDFYNKILEYYKNQQFMNGDGSLNQTTVVTRVTGVLKKAGLEATPAIQQVDNIWIYPADYFNPLDSLTGRLKFTENTRSIHWYMDSWSDNSSLHCWLSKMSHRVFGLKLHVLKEWIKSLSK